MLISMCDEEIVLHASLVYQAKPIKLIVIETLEADYMGRLLSGLLQSCRCSFEYFVVHDMDGTLLIDTGENPWRAHKHAQLAC